VNSEAINENLGRMILIKFDRNIWIVIMYRWFNS